MNWHSICGRTAIQFSFVHIFKRNSRKPLILYTVAVSAIRFLFHFSAFEKAHFVHSLSKWKLLVSKYNWKCDMNACDCMIPYQGANRTNQKRAEKWFKMLILFPSKPLFLLLSLNFRHIVSCRMSTLLALHPVLDSNTKIDKLWICFAQRKHPKDEKFNVCIHK